MAYLGNRFFTIVTLGASLFLASMAVARKNTSAHPLFCTRTLLAQASARESFSWNLFSSQGFTLVDLDDPKQRVALPAGHLVIRQKQDASMCESILFNDKKIRKKKLVMVPESGSMWVQGAEVKGPVLFVSGQEGCALIKYDGCQSSTQEAAQQLLKSEELYNHQYGSKFLDRGIMFLESVRAQKKLKEVTIDHPVSKSVELEQLESIEKQTKTLAPSKVPQHTVRVLLDEQGDGPFCWRLRMSGGFCVTQERHGEKKVSSQQDIEIRAYNEKVYINGHALKGPQCLITPASDVFFVQTIPYQGSVLITRYAGRWLLINCLDLEAYTESVLGSESWPGWPLEVNKVFAIVSRTYAIAMIMGARATHRPYHIKNTNQHQTYKGMHTNKILKEAVAQTKGVFIAYKRRPIIAMFDACCGGVIPAHHSGIDFVSAPYLAREYACTFCRACKIYSWQATYSLTELERILTGEVNGSVRGLQDVRVHKKDRAGLVHRILVKSRRATVIVSGKKMYSLLKKVKSFCYTVRKEGHTIVFKGRGYGHHVGLCQWGAREMVRQGYAYDQIISFYYPGTNLIRLP
jgi:stage II sporulation protein D